MIDKQMSMACEAAEVKQDMIFCIVNHHQFVTIITRHPILVFKISRYPIRSKSLMRIYIFGGR